MLDHARKAAILVTNRARSDLDPDLIFQLAMTRLVEIVGEAASRVSPAGRARFADIPWTQAIAARNRIVHGYDTVDDDIVWRILTEEFPVLVSALEQALPDHQS
jgi:uncharacterized protein with HEPN domain